MLLNYLCDLKMVKLNYIFILQQNQFFIATKVRLNMTHKISCI